MANSIKMVLFVYHQQFGGLAFTCMEAATREKVSLGCGMWIHINVSKCFF